MCEGPVRSLFLLPKRKGVCTVGNARARWSAGAGLPPQGTKEGRMAFPQARRLPAPLGWQGINPPKVWWDSGNCSYTPSGGLRWAFAGRLSWNEFPCLYDWSLLFTDCLLCTVTACDWVTNSLPICTVFTSLVFCDVSSRIRRFRVRNVIYILI